MLSKAVEIILSIYSRIEKNRVMVKIRFMSFLFQITEMFISKLLGEVTLAFQKTFQE